MAAPFVNIENAVCFSGNGDIWLESASKELDPAKLHDLVQLAWKHVNDSPLVEACCGGRGPLAEYFELNYPDYLRLLEKISVDQSAQKAKKIHTKVRRADYSARRSQLILQMIESGIPYICSRPNCNEHTDLTVDHIIPLSRGGSDELSNLQFLCRSHNSQKGDKI